MFRKRSLRPPIPAPAVGSVVSTYFDNPILLTDAGHANHQRRFIALADDIAFAADQMVLVVQIRIVVVKVMKDAPPRRPSHARSIVQALTKTVDAERLLGKLPAVAVPLYVIPVEVTGPTNFLLVAVWSKDSKDSPYVEGVVRSTRIHPGTVFRIRGIPAGR